MPTIRFPKVIFDFGAVARLPEELGSLGIASPIIVTDQGLARIGSLEKVRKTLSGDFAVAVFDAIPENPTVAGVEAAFSAFFEGRCDGIVALGGGSVIDSAKALAVLGGHGGPLERYLGHPERIEADLPPIVAMPTTAGTGSEVTAGAGIHPDAASRGSGVRSEHIVPKCAICDPELTLSLPPRLTAGTGMDALTHCVEGYLSPNTNPIVDAIALDGIARVVRHIEAAVADGSDREARWHLSMAALQGGIAISKGLGAAHAIGNTYGDKGFHHGMLVTLALPAVIRFLAPHVGDRMDVLAGAMGLASGTDVAAAVADLNARVGLPANYRAMGYPDGDRDEAADDAAKSWFTASPAKPSKADYRAMIDDLFAG